MPEWLIEHGIGEDRAVRIAAGEIVDAQVFVHGPSRAGTRLMARLKTSRPRAIADAEGQEYLLARGVSGVAEGAEIVIEVTREAIPGAEPWKRALAKITDQSPGPADPIAGEVLAYPAPTDVLGAAGWWDLLEEARTGVMQFPGGELRISATPAMTLIDVDGYLPADELVVAGAAAAARALRRLDIGGSIGIDLPTSGNRPARQAAAAVIDEVLPQPFERTAVNGFGFIQIVRPRARASLVELAQDRASFEARALLRRAAFEQPGPKRLVAHPRVVQILERHPAWLDALASQAGGTIALRAEPSLTISAGYAEAA